MLRSLRKIKGKLVVLIFLTWAFAITAFVFPDGNNLYFFRTILLTSSLAAFFYACLETWGIPNFEEIPCAKIDDLALGKWEVLARASYGMPNQEILILACSELKKEICVILREGLPTVFTIALNSSGEKTAYVGDISEKIVLSVPDVDSPAHS